MSDEAQAPGRRAAPSVGRTGPDVTMPNHHPGAWVCVAAGCVCACLCAGACAAIGATLGGSFLGTGTSTASGMQRESTEDQRRLEYAYYAFELRPCIASLNFPVDRVPNLEDFLRQQPQLAWSPWNTVKSSASHIEVATIERICPRDPVAGY